MDKVKRVILCAINTSICNFRCRYCYLSHRDEQYQGEQAKFAYPPEHVAKAFSKERLGGTCYFNFCAEGETLLTKRIDEYIYEIVKEGHYAEIVTNMTVTPVLDRILSWDKEMLERVTFKCSFHYLQLVERNLLDTFAANVKKAWESGASANIEITPDDELIPHIEDVKKFSLEHFGALPHLTIARDDRNEHDYLTDLTPEEYEKTWAPFDSGFWHFKRTIFGVKRNEYCYAGMWSLYVDLGSGDTTQCYCSRYSQNIYENVDEPIEFIPIEKCGDTHCYNGHALLTLGCIPNFTDVGYGDIRDRVREDGTHWIRPQMRAFLNSKLEESNPLITPAEKAKVKAKLLSAKAKRFANRIIKK